MNIPVTPEMIAAGRDALAATQAAGDPPSAVVRTVFAAMVEAIVEVQPAEKGTAYRDLDPALPQPEDAD